MRTAGDARGPDMRERGAEGHLYSLWVMAKSAVRTHVEGFKGFADLFDELLAALVVL